MGVYHVYFRGGSGGVHQAELQESILVHIVIKGKDLNLKFNEQCLVNVYFYCIVLKQINQLFNSLYGGFHLPHGQYF